MPLNKHSSKHNLNCPTKQIYSIFTILKKILLPIFKKTNVNLDLKKVVAQHLQFQPTVRGAAEKVLSKVAAEERRNQGNSKLFYVGVHVRLVKDSVLNNITMRTEGRTFTSLQGDGTAPLVKVFDIKSSSFPRYLNFR